ncbi:ricin-type beta-trefoil lectin domain protein, partial [Streptomyces sp. AC602_WCS936]
VNGKCLDVDNAGTADGTEVQVWSCNQSSAQEWTVGGDGTLKALGKCLDVSGGGSADGTRIQLWTCNGTGAQKWAAQSDGTVRNPQSGKCL